MTCLFLPLPAPDMVPHLLPVMMYQPQPTSTSLCHPFAPLQKRSEVEIDIILSPKQAQAFRDRINADGSDAHAIDGALAHVKSENAEASVQADLVAIRTLIQKYSGGFGTLNDTVKQYLRRWFVSQGGVKVVARNLKRSDARDRSSAPRRLKTNKVLPALQIRGVVPPVALTPTAMPPTMRPAGTDTK